MKIRYYPIAQIVLFAAGSIGLIIAFLFSILKFWLLIFILLFLYLIVLSNTNIIKVQDNLLRIISLSPFYKSHLLNINSITKISTAENLEHESDVNYGGSYFLFQKRYELEYTDRNGKKKKACFYIYNYEKETRILKHIKERTLR